MLVGQQYGFTTPFAESPGWLARYGDQEVSQFRSAEMIAEKWDISREEMEEFALASHDAGPDRHRRGPLRARDRRRVGDFDTDECPRETSLEKMAGLEPLAAGRPDHRRGRLADLRRLVGDADRLRAGASRTTASRRAPGSTTSRSRGDDPVWMLTGPIRATRHALEKTGLTVDDIDLFECNEAFASVVLAWMKETRRPARARSTSTAAASPSATRSAPPAPGS